MFLDACETALKVLRQIKIEKGNLLILGTGGKGRNCLSRLGIYLSGYKMYECGAGTENTT